MRWDSGGGRLGVRGRGFAREVDGEEGGEAGGGGEGRLRVLVRFWRGGCETRV
jgi:hypothetical protein